MTEVIRVQSKKDLKRFIDLPHQIYRGDRNYVPELYTAQKELFDKTKYPFFRHSEAEFFLAVRGGKAVGRIVAIRNNNYISFTDREEGFFGFFETVDDYGVAEALFAAAAGWLKDNGLKACIGPENYTVNDSCGILTEGFDLPPVVGMPYNKPTYPGYFERYGFAKKIDMAAYHFHSNKTPVSLQEHEKAAGKMLLQSGIRIRPFDMKNLEAEILKFNKAYNSAFEKNWGFVPMTHEEFSYQAKNLKKIADPGMVLLAEHNDEIIGFVITIPDVNQVLIRIRNGRLFPFGLLKFLYYKNRINGCRISIMGVSGNYRKMGLGALLYAKVFEMTRKKNITWAEASYVMEDNAVMNRNMQSIGGRIYKKYRIYELAL